MSLPNHLLKRIRTENHVYIYSGKTNQIFLITEAMNDILDFYGGSSEDEIVKKLSERHPVSSLEEGLGIINYLNQQYGHFSPGEFETRISRMTEKTVTVELSTGIPSICLEVTEACNLRCKYCIYSGGYLYNRTHGKNHMDWSTAKASIDFFNARHHGSKEEITNIGFYGGEPLLRFDFIRRCVEYAESLEWETSDLSFNMTTNGTLLTKDVIEFILDHKIMLTISLDGPQSEHDRNRVFPNGQGSFTRIFENIRHLYARASKEARQISPIINCIVSPGSDLIKLNEFFTKNAEIGLITQLMVMSVDPDHRTFFQECPPHPRWQQQQENLFRIYLEAHLRDFDPHAPENIFVRQFFQEPLLTLYRRPVCSTAENKAHLTRMCFPGKRRPYVTTDGSIHVCERINNTLPIGDVWNGFDIPKITRLWNEFAELADRDECRTCWALRLCTFCFRDVAGNGMFSSDLERSRCESIRDNWFDYLQIYCSLQESKPTAFDYMKDFKYM